MPCKQIPHINPHTPFTNMWNKFSSVSISKFGTESQNSIWDIPTWPTIHNLALHCAYLKLNYAALKLPYVALQLNCVDLRSSTVQVCEVPLWRFAKLHSAGLAPDHDIPECLHYEHWNSINGCIPWNWVL